MCGTLCRCPLALKERVEGGWEGERVAQYVVSNAELCVRLGQVSLVLILDADKEGFLRSDKSLIQVPPTIP